MSKLLVRYASVPALLIGVNGLALLVIFRAPTLGMLALGLALVGGLALVLSFGSERIVPYDPDWNHDRGDTARDLAHFVVNESLSFGPLLAGPLFVAMAPASDSWPEHWPWAFQGLLVLVVFDLGQNLFHWLAHVWSPLWRLHAVHHSVERMYGLNGILKHPLYQVLASVTSTAPLVALGMPIRFSLALAFLSFVQLLLQHSNADHRLGPLRRVFATAEVHRFHHLKGEAGNVNFALFFSAIDHLFGNAYEAERTLCSTDIGLEEPGYPVGWYAQLLAPFQRRRSGSGPVA